MRRILCAARPGVVQDSTLSDTCGAQILEAQRMGEQATFCALQKTWMGQNRGLFDVSEATLNLPDLAFARRG